MEEAAETVSTETTPQSDSAEEAQLRATANATGGFGQDPEATTSEPDKTEGSAEQSEPRASDTVEGKDKSEIATDKDGDEPRSPEPSAEEPEAPKSSYQARKSERDQLADDQKRLAKNWQEFSEGKLKWQADQNAKFDAMQQQLAQAIQGQQAPPRNEPSPQEYITAAKEFEQKARSAAAEGDPEGADKYLRLSSQARDAAQQTYWKGQEQQQQQSNAQFQQTWQAHMQAEIDRWPDLQNPNSPVSQQMADILDKNPEFSLTPNGFAKASQVLRWQMDSAESSGLREKVTQLETQLKQLQAKTQISGGGVTPHAEPKNPDDMNDAELERYLRRSAAGLDSLALA